VKKLLALVLYLQEDDKAAVFDRSIDADEVTQFINSEAIPLIGEMSPATFETYENLKLPLGLPFLESDKKERLVATLKEVAAINKHLVSFASIDAKIFG
jgi:protein disulfide-isomerase A1